MREYDGEFAKMVKARELTLELRRYALAWVSSSRLEHHNYEDDLTLRMKHQLCFGVFCRRASRVVTFEPVSYPATWWQAFKLCYFVAWMLKRWPVRMTTVTREPVTVEAEALFPELEPVRGRNNMKIYYYINEGDQRE